MSRMVLCKKYQKQLPGLTFVPFDDELGRKIYHQISAQAWTDWLEHSKMLVNEYRLDLMSKEAFTFLHARCEAFLFGTDSVLPPEFKPLS